MNGSDGDKKNTTILFLVHTELEKETQLYNTKHPMMMNQNKKIFFFLFSFFRCLFKNMIY